MQRSATFATGNYAVEERTLLSAEGDFIDRTCYPYAFNEVTIQRHDTSMIAAEVFVDGEMIATCHGDGMAGFDPVGFDGLLAECRGTGGWRPIAAVSSFRPLLRTT